MTMEIVEKGNRKLLIGLWILVLCCNNAVSDTVDGQRLANELKQIKVDIGVDHMQDVFNKLPYKIITESGSLLRTKTQDSLDQSLADLDAVLENLKNVLIDSSAESTTNSLPLCCELTDDQLQYNAAFRQEVNTEKACITVSSIPTTNIKYPTQAVSDKMKSNYENNRNVLWQHYSTTQGVSIIFPATRPKKFQTCGSFDPRFTSSYAAAAYPKQKDVVIVLETSNAMNAQTGSDKTKLGLAREAVYNVLQTLTPDDRVGIVAFDTEVRTPHGSDFHDCYRSKLSFASKTNVDSLKKFVFSIQQPQNTDQRLYEKGLRKAFEYFQSSNGSHDFENKERIILFISAGPDTSNIDPAMIIREENAKLNNKIRIYTYLLSQELTAKNMLKKMADQGEIDVTKGPKLDGHFEEFDTTRLSNLELSPELATFYLHLPKEQQDHPSLSVPFVDPYSEKGLITSRCLPVETLTAKLQGVVCTDVKISELLKEVEFFSEDEFSYAFIIDGTGRAIMHPLLPNAEFVTNTPVLVDVSVLEHSENKTAVAVVIESMKSGNTGNATFQKYFIKPRGKLVNDGSASKIHSAELFWGPVPRSNFSLCVVLVDRSSEIDETNIGTNSFNKQQSFMFHKRNLVLESFKDCKFYKRKVTLERSSVKFSPSAFTNPFEYIDRDVTAQDVSSYTKYFTKETDTNPGFKSTVRPMIWVTQKAEEFWKEKKARHVSWRYMGTKAGFIRIYPAVSLQKSYDHEKRAWWRQSLAHPGKLILTTPYVDAWGSGIVLSVIHTIYKRGTETVTATVGADLPLEYFNWFINSVYPECKQSNLRCMIVDDSGFIVMHPRLRDTTTEAEFKEPKHITVEEKHLSEKMIAEGLLSVNNYCDDLSESKTLRSFRVTMISGSPDGLSFAQTDGLFEIRPIADTNVFFIEADASKIQSPPCTCDDAKSPDVVLCTDSCNCLCHRPINYDMCSNSYNISNIILPCSARLPDTSGVSDPDDTSGLQQCFKATCPTKTSQTNCYSETECSWCEYTITGQLMNPPCCRLKEQCTFGRAKAEFSNTCDVITTTPNLNNNADGSSGRSLTDGERTAVIAGGCLAAGILLTIATIVVFKACRRRSLADDPDPYITPVASEELKVHASNERFDEPIDTTMDHSFRTGQHLSQPNTYTNAGYN